MSNLRFGVLGPVRVWRGAVELEPQRPQAQAVLAALLLREGAPAALDELIDGIWGCGVPRTARNVVRNYISGLRNLLGDRGEGIIRTVGGGYAIVTASATFDVAQFRALLASARAAREAGDKTTAMAHFAECLALWEGPPLAGVPGPYARAQRAQLDELRLLAIEERIACAVDAGLHAQVVADLSTLVRDHPLHERFRELHVLALHGAGRQAEAFVSYREASRLSREELGVGPGPGLRNAYQRILEAESPPAPASRARVVPRSSLAPGTAPPEIAHLIPPAQLPAVLPCFVGRKHEFDLVAGAVPPGTGTKERATCTVIHGMAGSGKTAFAVRWAHEVAPKYPDGQLFADLRGFDPATGGADPADVLLDFLIALGTPASRVPESAEARAALYRSIVARRRVLILLDDARDEAQVRPLLPGADGCLVIVTSRNRLSGLVGTHQGRLLAMPLLSRGEARELVARAAGPTRMHDAKEIVGEIVDRCAGLPLALASVAARIELLSSAPLSAIAAELDSAAVGLEAFRSGDDPAMDVRAVFLRSYQGLDEPAMRLFRFLSLHPGPEITAPAAAGLAATTTAETSVLLRRLAATHLLDEHAPGRYSQHTLLRAHADELSRAVESDDERLAAVERLSDYYCALAEEAALAFAPGGPSPQTSTAIAGEDGELVDADSASSWFARERRTLLELIGKAAISGFDRHAWRLASALDRYLAFTGQRAARLATRRMALRAVMHARQGNAAVCAETHRKVSRLFEQEGAYRDALAHTQRAVHLYAAAEDAEGRALCLSAIGRYHSLLGEHHRSLAYCRYALRVLRRMGNRGGEADAWRVAGCALHHLGQHPRAVASYQRALEYYRDHGCQYAEADTLVCLGDTHRAAGHVGDALDSWTSSLNIFERLAHPDVHRARARIDELGWQDPSAAGPGDTGEEHRQRRVVGGTQALRQQSCVPGRRESSAGTCAVPEQRRSPESRKTRCQ